MSAAADGSLTLALVGDIWINRPDPITAFEGTAEALRAADVLFGNCETAISEYGEPVGKPYPRQCIRMTPDCATALAEIGFDVMSVDSNHLLDYGRGVMLRTGELLDAAGIRHCGSGRNIDEAHRPAIVTKNGVTLAFLAYTSVYWPGWEASADRPGLSTVHVETVYKPHPRVLEQPGAPATALTFPDPVDRDRMVQDVRAAKEKADLVIVSWHWGISERYRSLVSYQIELGHLALDAGADLIVGHHPHMLQGVEIYRGKPLFYSLGNFMFDRDQDSFGPESMIVRCRVVNKRIDRVSVLPCFIDDQHVPRLQSPEPGSPVVRLLEEASARFGTRFRQDGAELVIE